MQKRFERAIHHHRRSLTSLVQRLESGALDADEFGDSFDALLWKAHTDGVVLGRQHGGDRARANEDDELLGLEIKDGESEYLNNFIEDIKAGRYTDADGNLRVGAVKQRANLYISKVRGTANEAFVNASDDDELFDWIMLGTEHCDDCPQFAALSPFTKSELYTYPGAGDTECLGNCQCILVRRSDGKEGFKPVG